MMRFDPTLIVKRLVVNRNEHVTYDEQFHRGVNVVRGANSSGKSTVLNFIFYGLGGDLSDWSAAALQCTSVTVEVELNGHEVVLRREIASKAGQSMDVFAGTYAEALRAPITSWTRYPYRTSSLKESFSQCLFRLLAVPEVNNETSGNITMHQLLRLLYADQLTPVDDLFRFEQFDPPNLREAVARLLCGAYDGILYENELRLKAFVSEHDELSSRLKSLFAVIGETGQSVDFDWLEAQKTNVISERSDAIKAIEKAESEIFENLNSEQLSLQSQNRAYENTRTLQNELGAISAERDLLAMRSADSASFIARLEQKLNDLQNSKLTADHFGHITFAHCPGCFSTLEDRVQTENNCSLCGSVLTDSPSSSRIVELINETSLQLKQSRQLQEVRRVELEKLQVSLAITEDKWRVSAIKLSELRRLPTSESREKLRELQRALGYLDRKIEDLEEKSRLVRLVGSLSEKKRLLLDEIERLKTQNAGLRASQNQRLQQSYTAIADEIRILLKNDLRRENAFENPNSIQIDFGKNKIAVDGQSYFSASSRVVLRSSFFLGFMAAATKHSHFRHPRFAMIDTTEDKGMEVERSHNLQIQILRISQESKVEHQIIYATSMIAPELDELAFTVGNFSTRDEYTLDVSV